MAGELRRVDKAVDPLLQDLGVELGLLLVCPLGFVNEFSRAGFGIGAVDGGLGLLPDQDRHILPLLQLILRLEDGALLHPEGGLRLDQLVRRLRLAVGDVNRGAGLRQLQLELLQLLYRGFGRRLVIELALRGRGIERRGVADGLAR